MEWTSEQFGGRRCVLKLQAEHIKNLCKWLLRKGILQRAASGVQCWKIDKVKQKYTEVTIHQI